MPVPHGNLRGTPWAWFIDRSCTAVPLCSTTAAVRTHSLGGDQGGQALFLGHGCRGGDCCCVVLEGELDVHSKAKPQIR